MLLGKLSEKVEGQKEEDVDEEQLLEGVEKAMRVRNMSLDA